MKAIVLEKIGAVSLQDCEPPQVKDEQDAIVRVTTAGICGSDLHIVEGRDRGAKIGTIMGHEFVGIVQETASGVRSLEAGDRIVAPFTINCGQCFFCRRELPARCLHSAAFGFVTEEGQGLSGAQAEFVRVPFAAATLMKVPEKAADGSPLTDEDVLFLGDIFSTAYSCAENAAIQKRDVVVIVGCGPVGLLCIIAAKLFEPGAVVAIDPVEYRLEKAKSFGAIPVRPDVNSASRLLSELTEGRGADAVLEVVGNPSALDLAINLSRPGAIVSIAGYHTEAAYSLPIQLSYQKNLTFKMGRCNARKYMPLLLPLVTQRRLPIKDIITHILPLNEGIRGYDLFRKHKQGAIKVLLKP